MYRSRMWEIVEASSSSKIHNLAAKTLKHWLTLGEPRSLVLPLGWLTISKSKFHRRNERHKKTVEMCMCLTIAPISTRCCADVVVCEPMWLTIDEKSYDIDTDCACVRVHVCVLVFSLSTYSYMVVIWRYLADIHGSLFIAFFSIEFLTYFHLKSHTILTVCIVAEMITVPIRLPTNRCDIHFFMAKPFIFHGNHNDSCLNFEWQFINQIYRLNFDF